MRATIDPMTPQEIKRAYDEAAAEVLEEHRVRIAKVLDKGQKNDDAARLEAVRAKLIDPLV